jgi:hypothetical protein
MNGNVGINNSFPQERLQVDGNIRTEGVAFTVGSSGNDISSLTFLIGFPNNGYVTARDGSGTEQAGLYVNSAGQGVVFADVKKLSYGPPFRRFQKNMVCFP